MKKLLFLVSIFTFLFLSSCNEEAPIEQNNNSEASLSKKSANPISANLDDLNARLAAEGSKVRVAYAEILTEKTSENDGILIFFSNVGNKQLGHHWVPGDPNRGGRTNITWLKEQVAGLPNGVSTIEDANDAINSAMDTWQNANCSVIPLEEVGDDGIDWGIVQFFYWYDQSPGQNGGNPDWDADITHAGWLPGDFFDAVLGPGASNNVLGVTFTFVWTDSDMDNNRKADVAFREIYYNNNFEWATDGGHFDVETIVLHETGHGLSQGHFGTAFGTYANGKIHFAPRAVMNAAYSGVQRDLAKTDNAGHCSIWARWPNN